MDAFPQGLALGRDGNLYVSLNRGAGPIRKLSPAGSTLASIGQAGLAGLAGYAWTRVRVGLPLRRKKPAA